MERTRLLTNEEKKVNTYHTETPTDPRLVTPATSLDELNLNWREKDLPERKRTKHVHRLHPYLGKFIPQLVEIFLRKYFRAGETVYDPFCGSGTTLVEANVLNLNSIGCDIAAFKRYSLDTIRRVKQYSRLRKKAEVTVLWGDARTVSLPRKIDGVITSPPYVGLIDYHEQHRYAYELLDLLANIESEIGAAFKGNSQSAKEAYQREIASVFAHTGEYMDSGKRMIIVVRDRDKLYDDIAAQCGFEFENTIRRHVNRRTGRRANEFFEEVLIWRKR